MITVKELYDALSARYPLSMQSPGDRDGLMVSQDLSSPVRRILCVLDVSDRMIDYAVKEGYDLILSHHPMIREPLPGVANDTVNGRKVIKLLQNGISVFSFHTRADRAPGGVNDLLSKALGLLDTVPFAEEMGRVGHLPSPVSLEEFAAKVKETLGAPVLSAGKSGAPVYRVAVLGGTGRSCVADAMAAGADTYLSGELSYGWENAAAENGINLIAAGHFHTEAVLPRFWKESLPKEFPVECGYLSSLEQTHF